MSQDPRRIDPSVVPGATPAPFPGFIEPCHPTLRQKAPSGGDWVHEIKFDGYRTQGHLRNGEPAIYTRRGYDWTRRFQPIADALAALSPKDVILDGEAVVADSRGMPDFGLLHADLAAGRQDRLLYYAFDLLSHPNLWSRAGPAYATVAPGGHMRSPAGGDCAHGTSIERENRESWAVEN